MLAYILQVLECYYISILLSATGPKKAFPNTRKIKLKPRTMWAVSTHNYFFFFKYYALTHKGTGSQSYYYLEWRTVSSPSPYSPSTDDVCSHWCWRGTTMCIENGLDYWGYLHIQTSIGKHAFQIKFSSKVNPVQVNVLVLTNWAHLFLTKTASHVQTIQRQWKIKKKVFY